MRGKKQGRAYRWNREHGGSGRKQQYGGKIAHATVQEAVRHADALNRCTDIPGVFGVYQCRWGADYRDGETAAPHWHVGRPSRVGSDA